MISALIISKNRVNNVIKLARKLIEYVDEIVIIDQSDKKKFEYLKRKLPYARIYWLPPLGTAEFYYKVGLDLCNGDWVLYLDDDEEPSEKLLKSLKQLAHNPNVYSIVRLHPNGKAGNKYFRFFYEDFIIPIGLLHWSWGSNVEPKDLGEKYFIIHHEYSNKIDFNKIKVYSIIESLQYGVKIYYAIFNNKTTKIYHT